MRCIPLPAPLPCSGSDAFGKVSKGWRRGLAQAILGEDYVLPDEPAEQIAGRPAVASTEEKSGTVLSAGGGGAGDRTLEDAIGFTMGGAWKRDGGAAASRGVGAVLSFGMALAAGIALIGVV